MESEVIDVITNVEMDLQGAIGKINSVLESSS